MDGTRQKRLHGRATSGRSSRDKSLSNALKTQRKHTDTPSSTLQSGTLGKRQTDYLTQALGCFQKIPFLFFAVVLSSHSLARIFTIVPLTLPVD